MELFLSAEDSVINDMVQPTLRTDEERKQWNKIIANSCYYPTASKHFHWFNPEIAESITKQAKELLK